MAFRVAVLTVSDRCSRGEAEDRSGPALVEAVKARLEAEITDTACVADDEDAIIGRLHAWSHGGQAIDLILTTGGTGLSPRDRTPEATLRVLDRRHTGLIELMRLRCYDITPMTFLSRGEAGTIGRTLIINLPGSPRGAVQWFDAVADVLPHALESMRGGPDASHPGAG